MVVARRRFIAGLATFILVPGRSHAVPPPGKIHRIGFIVLGAASEVRHLTNALDDGLRELGYREGQNFLYERRFADGVAPRLDILAAELVSRNVDVIVTGSNPAISAAQRATAKIPIVMAVSRDPVGSGFVATISRPGGNVTGMASDPAPDIIGKHVELLIEAFPTVSRIALLWNPVPPGAEGYRRAVETASEKRRIALHIVSARARHEFDRAFAEIRGVAAEALVVLPDPVFFTARADIAALAVKARLPSIYFHREHVEAGGLLSYGANITHQFRRAATFVDKILNGAHPGLLPIEQATTFEMLVNLRTAKALGVAIPQALLLRAAQVIE